MIITGFVSECDDLKNCESCKRIDFLMEYYSEWTFRKSNNFNMTGNDVDRMIDFVDNLENYNIIKLLNDYYHLIDYHSEHLSKKDSKVPKVTFGIFKSR